MKSKNGKATFPKGMKTTPDRYKKPAMKYSIVYPGGSTVLTSIEPTIEQTQYIETLGGTVTKI